jgi:hypothetical protein
MLQMKKYSFSTVFRNVGTDNLDEPCGVVYGISCATQQI